MTVLRFQDVGVRYPGDDRPALDGCTMEVAAGERVALVGGNGSGKTTILLATVGLVPHTGRIDVCGERLDPADPSHARRNASLLFSNPEDQILFPRVLDDVAFSLTSRGVPDDVAAARARSTLDRLGAGALADRSPYRLSRGQRLRVALAATLVVEPPLLLLDEPTSGLDPAGLRALTAQLSALPAAMLVATHDLAFARQCCQRYVRMDGGRAVQSGTSFDEVSL